jgi:hypothetical protein
MLTTSNELKILVNRGKTPRIVGNFINARSGKLERVNAPVEKVGESVVYVGTKRFKLPFVFQILCPL